MEYDDRFENLSEEAKAKVRACKTVDELAELARKEGVELSVDQLDDVAGGGDFWKNDPDCSALNSSPV